MGSNDHPRGQFFIINAAASFSISCRANPALLAELGSEWALLQLLSELGILPAALVEDEYLLLDYLLIALELFNI